MRHHIYAVALLGLYAPPAAAWGVPKEYLQPLEHRHPDCPQESHVLGFGNGATSEDQTGLSAGVYTDTITDANGCQVTHSSTLLNNAGTLNAMDSLVDATCGNANGAVDQLFS